MFPELLEYPSCSFVVKNQVPFGMNAKIVHIDL